MEKERDDFAQFALKILCDIEDKLIGQDEDCCLDVVLYMPDILEINSSIGTHVINISSANFQIWLSSPVSGPTHFSYSNGNWVSKKNNKKLYSVLQSELSSLIPNLALK